MNLAIVGSREFPSMWMVSSYVEVYQFTISRIISGGATGVDTAAEAAADARGIPKTILYPDWDLFGKSAGMRRNKDIVAAADHVVAFWDGKSKGTKNTIDLAKKAGKLLEVITVERYT